MIAVIEGLFWLMVGLFFGSILGTVIGYMATCKAVIRAVNELDKVASKAIEELEQKIREELGK